jgi:large subunit ribosomal protein L17
MRHLVDHRKLGRSTSHRKALLRSLATALILAERIETTLPKAKELRRLADELITWGKDGSLHARRQAARVIQNPDALKKLFNGLSGRFADRNGGYTRIYKYGFRRGDSAEMAAIEYLGYQLPAPKAHKEEDHEDGEKAAKKKAEKKTEKKVAEKKAKADKAEKKISKKSESASGAKTEKSDKKSGGLKGLFGRKKKSAK